MDKRLQQLLSQMDMEDAKIITSLLNKLSDSSLDDVTLEEAEKRLEETRAKIKQIEAKALRKLKERELNPACNFCSSKPSEVKHMLKSDSNLYICNNCIEACYEQLQKLQHT
ncbi:MAG: hypothetical protein FJ190_13205 [Gammaproteobacteria bacterium]|nr:hypothetical protein [Gammaproteobacteria bacterium]